jgi:hypothetical protein
MSETKAPRQGGFVSIRGRLQRLEVAAGGLPCASCGLLPTGPGFTVYGEPEGPQTCEACGRPLYFVIEVAGPGVLSWP